MSLSPRTRRGGDQRERLRDAADIPRVRAAGLNAMLIGAKNVPEKMRELLLKD